MAVIEKWKWNGFLSFKKAFLKCSRGMGSRFNQSDTFEENCVLNHFINGNEERIKAAALNEINEKCGLICLTVFGSCVDPSKML